MEENYLVALIMAFIFGFVLLKKDKSLATDVSTSKAKSYGGASGETGVAKYLNQHQAEVKVSGVAKYLQEKQLLEDEKAESLVVSGVEKYLASKNQQPASGVSKYMAKKAIYAKKMAKENVSGVEKYLNNRG